MCEFVPPCRDFPETTTLWYFSSAKKAREEILHKKFGAPRPPPLEILYVGFFFFLLYFEGKRGPKHKEFCGVKCPFGGRGLGGGVSAQILYVYALFWFLN